MMVKKTKVKLDDLHDKFENGEISITEVAKQLAERLKTSPHYRDDNRLAELAFYLENIEEVDEYDSVLDDLYNFGDEEVMMTLDHVFARADGGPDIVENSQPMCALCNETKGSVNGKMSRVPLYLEIIFDELRKMRDSFGGDVPVELDISGRRYQTISVEHEGKGASLRIVLVAVDL
jgi:hypothetical protein